jgi:hypothetical protein
VVYNEMVQESEQGVKSRDFPIVALDFEHLKSTSPSIRLYSILYTLYIYHVRHEPPFCDATTGVFVRFFVEGHPGPYYPGDNDACFGSSSI